MNCTRFDPIKLDQTTCIIKTKDPRKFIFFSNPGFCRSFNSDLQPLSPHLPPFPPSLHLCPLSPCLHPLSSNFLSPLSLHPPLSLPLLSFSTFDLSFSVRACLLALTPIFLSVCLCPLYASALSPPSLHFFFVTPPSLFSLCFCHLCCLCFYIHLRPLSLHLLRVTKRTEMIKDHTCVVREVINHICM